jgi:hypothetical protein
LRSPGAQAERDKTTDKKGTPRNTELMSGGTHGRDRAFYAAAV